MCLRHVVEHSYKAKVSNFDSKKMRFLQEFLFFIYLFIYLFFVTRDISKICHGVQDTTL